MSHEREDVVGDDHLLVDAIVKGRLLALEVRHLGVDLQNVKLVASVPQRLKEKNYKRYCLLQLFDCTAALLLEINFCSHLWPTV